VNWQPSEGVSLAGTLASRGRLTGLSQSRFALHIGPHRATADKNSPR
jgi:hypothetical protein